MIISWLPAQLGHLFIFLPTSHTTLATSWSDVCNILLTMGRSVGCRALSMGWSISWYEQLWVWDTGDVLDEPVGKLVGLRWFTHSIGSVSPGSDYSSSSAPHSLCPLVRADMGNMKSRLSRLTRRRLNFSLLSSALLMVTRRLSWQPFSLEQHPYPKVRGDWMIRRSKVGRTSYKWAPFPFF